MTPDEFTDKIDGFGGLPASTKANILLYYLTEIRGEETGTRARLEECFRDIDESAPSYLATHLSNGLRSKPKRVVKRQLGYRLEKNFKRKLESEFGLKSLGSDQVDVKVSAHWRELEGHLSEEARRKFFHEVSVCYSSKAYRATIIMGWLLAVDVLHDSIIDRHLSNFNAALAADPQSAVSKIVISIKSDLGSLKESKLIEVAQRAKIISRDVKKIWDERLNLRNSAAHPSNIEIGPAKAAAFIEDVVQNMILKIN